MDKKIQLLEKILKNEGGVPNSNNPETGLPIQTKLFKWPQLNSGDCQMNAGSTLTLFSNGIARFDCQTLCFKTHSGDTWHHFLSIYDQNMNSLFTGGYFDSPRMDDGNPPPVYSWSAAFTFDPSKFDAAAKAVAYYSA